MTRMPLWASDGRFVWQEMERETGQLEEGGGCCLCCLACVSHPPRTGRRAGRSAGEEQHPLHDPQAKVQWHATSVQAMLRSSVQMELQLHCRIQHALWSFPGRGC